MTVIALKNWNRHQHYKDRDPPWVKLYRDLLTAESWVLGTDTSRVLQVACVLLAARYSNAIPRSWNVIRKVTNLDCSEQDFETALAHLVQSNFLEIQERTSEAKPLAQVASKPLAKCSSEAEQRRDRAEGEGERARARVPRGAQDAGDALTRTPSAEDVLAGMLDAWREVDGVDPDAMTAWLAHWSRVHAGREMPCHQRLATAKLLAGLGDAATQRRAVQTAEANGWKALRHGDGKNPVQAKTDAAAAARAESERVELANLTERAERVGFRRPTKLDDLAGYRTLVERAEANQPRKGVTSIAKLLAGNA